MIKHIFRYFKVALAAFFVASTAYAQNSGTVTQYAFAIGKGPGTTGYTSLLCASTQIAIGQTSANPACAALSGDITMNASGVTAIGSGKVTSTMLNSNVFSTAHTWSGQQTFVAPILGTPASGTLTNATGLPISTGVSGLGTGIATALGVNVGSAGAPVLLNGALGTPSSGTLTNATGLPIAGITGLGTGVGTALGNALNGASGLVGYSGSLGTPTSGTLSTGITFNASNVTWSGTVPVANLPAIPNTSGSTSASAGVVKVDGTTITASSGVLTAVGAAATSIGVGTTTISSGTASNLLYNNAGTLGNGTIASFLTAGTGISITGTTNATVALSTPVSVANGGTGDTGTAWATFTPTLSCITGTLTSSSVAGKYKTIGKTVFVALAIAITNAGTCGTALYVTLPVNNASVFAIPGADGGINGKSVIGRSDNGTRMLIQYYDGTSPAFSGSSFAMSGVYESI